MNITKNKKAINSNLDSSIASAVELEPVAESHEYENKPITPTKDIEDFYEQILI